ncbi:MAG: Wzz/FepE/Etk N-terminal domain-containing protein [Gemmatimonadota bacterium]
MTEAAPPRRPPVDDEISLWEVMAVLVRRRWTIVLTALALGGGAGGIAHVLPLEYTTTASFRPQGSDMGGSQLMALASQFGVAVPGGGSGEEASPAFYAELLTSREILTRIAVEVYDVDGFGEVLLKDLLEIEEPTEPIRDQEALRWLVEEAVGVSTGRETGTVTVTVTSEWADLSHAIAGRLLDEVSRFNMDTRQSQAASEREFIERRVQAAEGELEAAEDSLRVFLEQNRQLGSPLLQFRQAALQREVTLRSTVLTALVQSLDQAEIAEVRDTPVITIIQPPFMPPKNDPRRRVLAALLGLILGGMLGMVLAFVREAFGRPDDGDPARADFRESWDGFMSSIPLVGRR